MKVDWYEYAYTFSRQPEGGNETSGTVMAKNMNHALKLVRKKLRARNPTRMNIVRIGYRFKSSRWTAPKVINL